MPVDPIPARDRAARRRLVFLLLRRGDIGAEMLSDERPVLTQPADPTHARILRVHSDRTQR
jgi:hypothetical protein